MASRPHRISIWQAAIAAALALSLAAAFPALAGEEPAGDEPQAAAPKAAPTPTRTVTVGKATLTWRRAPAVSAKRAELVAAFQQATEAHLTGGEPYVTPKAEPVTLPGGQLMLPLPVEMMHTMFVGAAGQNYCSDSTVAVKAAAVTNADGEGR